MSAPAWMTPSPLVRMLRWWNDSTPMRKLISGVLVLALAASACGAKATPIDAEPSSSEPVVLTAAEADSVLALIDDQGLRLELLETDLWEARRLARADSTLAADQLRLQKQAYETMLEAYRDDRGNWLERAARHPLVWFALGVWLSGQAVN